MLRNMGLMLHILQDREPKHLVGCFRVKEGCLWPLQNSEVWIGESFQGGSSLWLLSPPRLKSPSHPLLKCIREALLLEKAKKSI